MRMTKWTWRNPNTGSWGDEWVWGDGSEDEPLIQPALGKWVWKKYQTYEIDDEGGVEESFLGFLRAKEEGRVKEISLGAASDWKAA